MNDLNGYYKENGRSYKSDKETASVRVVALRCSNCDYKTFVEDSVEFGEEGRCPECGALLVENSK